MAASSCQYHEMGSHTPHRDHHMGHFLLTLLNNQEIHGLEWVNRDAKLFKIPWVDKRKKGPIWDNFQNEILRKWEMYNGRHKVGEPDRLTEWKQTFRGALNKSPYVTAVHEMHELQNTSSMPFKVYKFTETKKRKRSPNTKKLSTEGRSSPPESGLNFHLDEYDEQYKNVPRVVLDELTYNNNNISTSTNSPAYPESVHTQSSPSNLSQSPPEFMDILDVSPMSTSHTNGSAAASPFMDYQGIAMQNPSPNQMQIHNPPIPISVPDPCPVDIPIIQFQAFYLNKQVLNGFMGNRGVRFFFGSQSPIDCLKIINSDPIAQDRIKGPDYFEQYELPDIMKCKDILDLDRCDSNNFQDLQNVLENMSRGILFYSSQRNLYTYRLCTTRVFASYSKGNKGESCVIERKHKSVQNIFDMEVFEHQVRSHKLDPQNVSCPSTTVILAFGREFTHGAQPLVHLELTSLEAERMLRREMHERQDVQISGFDSVDLLERQFKDTLMNSNLALFE